MTTTERDHVEDLQELACESTCWKKHVSARLVTRDGQTFDGWNTCTPPWPEGSIISHCPRLTLPSGERYDLCGPAQHAEEMALDAAMRYYGSHWRYHLEGAEMLIYGHEVICANCQQLLKRSGVHGRIVPG